MATAKEITITGLADVEPPVAWLDEVHETVKSIERDEESKRFIIKFDSGVMPLPDTMLPRLRKSVTIKKGVKIDALRYVVTDDDGNRRRYYRYLKVDGVQAIVPK